MKNTIWLRHYVTIFFYLSSFICLWIVLTRMYNFLFFFSLNIIFDKIYDFFNFNISYKSSNLFFTQNCTHKISLVLYKKFRFCESINLWAFTALTLWIYGHKKLNLLWIYSSVLTPAPNKIQRIDERYKLNLT